MITVSVTGTAARCPTFVAILLAILVFSSKPHQQVAHATFAVIISKREANSTATLQVSI